MPEESRRVRKVRPAWLRRRATQPHSLTRRPASPAPSSPQSASRWGHCRGCNLSSLASAAWGDASSAVVAASVARVRSVGGERVEEEGEAEPESRRKRRRCGAGGLRRLSGFRRERRESGEARRREDAIGGDVRRKRREGLETTTMGFLMNHPDGLILPARILQ